MLLFDELGWIMRVGWNSFFWLRCRSLLIIMVMYSTILISKACLVEYFGWKSWVCSVLGGAMTVDGSYHWKRFGLLGSRLGRNDS